jgi:uncharacterized protein YcaQ
VVEIVVVGDGGCWYALARDLERLAAAGRRRTASRGATLLSPFDSFLWHRERIARLFGFDYRLEVYVPPGRRTFGYYALPLLVDGQLIGRIDTKLHRAGRRLELRHVHFEPWFATGAPPPAATWGAIALDRGLAGLGEAAWSLATFTGAQRVRIGRVTPHALRTAVRSALSRHPGEPIA